MVNQQLNGKKRDRVPRAVVIAGIISLIVGGLAILIGVIYLMVAPSAPQPAVKTSMNLIAGDAGSAITIDNRNPEETKQHFREEIQSAPAPASPGDIRVFPIMTGADEHTQVSIADLFSRLFTSAPESLIQATEPRYVFGIIGPSKTPFFVLSIQSAGTAYGPMREWEDTLAADLGSVLSPSTKASDASFTTEVIRNKEARVLTNQAGESVIAYMFLDDATLAITGRPDVLRELLQARRSAAQAQNN